jgi:hypothetical protein
MKEDTMANKPPYGPCSFKESDAPLIYGEIPDKQRSMHLYKGRLCFFFNLYGEIGAKNEAAEDGFICAHRGPYQSVPKAAKQPLIASVFVREKEGEDHKYYGDVSAIVYEDDDRNKMLWG